MTFGQPTTTIRAKASDADALERRRAAKARDWVGLGVHGATAELRQVLVSVRVLLATISATLLWSSAASHSLAQAFACLGFAAYAGWLFILELRGGSLPDSHAVYWTDALWCLLLLALQVASQHNVSIILFFPVLFTALRWGPRYGTVVAIVMAASVLLLISIQIPGYQNLGNLVPLTFALVVLGPLSASLAGSAASIGRRLTLAKELQKEADPRFGVESVGHTALQQLCKEFRAQAGILAIGQPDGTVSVYRCHEAGPATTVPPLSGAALAQQLLALPTGLAAVYDDGTSHPLRALHYDAYDLDTSDPVNVGRYSVAALAALIECPSLVTIPVGRHGQSRGRLLIGVRGRSLDPRDASFLCHIMDQLSPTLENAALLERLAAEAAEHERTRIGRDLHDSAIQPYIGLKFAIEALARRVPAEDPLSPDVRHLSQMVGEELEALRDLVSGLRSGAVRGDGALMPSVRRQAARFAQLFGITVEVDVEGEPPVSRRLAGELFHMVSEGLSNIRRHSRVSHAWINLHSEAGFLVLQIVNDHGSGVAPPAAFRPRSLSERAEALGGTLKVAVTKTGYTSVTVRIPLEQ